MFCPCVYMEANDDSYHMPVWIGIGISIGKVSSSVLGIESIIHKKVMLVLLYYKVQTRDAMIVMTKI